jgi:hypothetical protein
MGTESSPAIGLDEALAGAGKVVAVDVVNETASAG